LTACDWLRHGYCNIAFHEYALLENGFRNIKTLRTASKKRQSAFVATVHSKWHRTSS
jgi:hypothetical protein